MTRALQLCAAAFGSLALGCGPVIPESWQVVDVLDLGMVVTVDELGPLSTVEPTARPFAAAMPLDTVRAELAIVDEHGPIPADELDVSWTVCESLPCFGELESPPCPEDGFAYFDTCGLPQRSGAAVLRFPEVAHPDEAAVFATSGGVVGFNAIGSRRGDPGAEACVDRLRRNVDLGSCFIVQDGLTMGSVDELTVLAHALGADLPPGFPPDFARQFPRNRAPLIEALQLSRDDGPPERVTPDTPISVSVGESLTFTWVPSEDDRDALSIEREDGTILTSEDSLNLQWWTTQYASTFEFTPASLQLTWVVGPDEGTFHLFAMANDDLSARGWTAFEVEVSR